MRLAASDVRVRAREARVILGGQSSPIGLMRLYAMLDHGEERKGNRPIFTKIQDNEDGPIYLYTDELYLWLATVGTPEERAAAVIEFRKKNCRVRREL